MKVIATTASGKDYHYRPLGVDLGSMDDLRKLVERQCETTQHRHSVPTNMSYEIIGYDKIVVFKDGLILHTYRAYHALR